MTAKNKTPKENPVYKKITGRLVSMIEAGVDPWTAGFMQAANQAPRNAHAGNQYNGINYLMLSLVKWFEQYPENLWLTYHQAAELGGYVRKDEKSPAEVIFYSLINKRTQDEENEYNHLKDNRIWNDRRRELNKKVYIMAKYSNVFNIAQVDGIDQARLIKHKPEPPETKDHTPIQAAEAMVSEMPNPPAINFGGNQPAYSPGRDSIIIPPLERYETADRYYKTLFHELAHSTGHQTRLNRDGIVNWAGFGSKPYSFEELIAELTAAFLAAETGLNTEDTDKNTAAYLKGWIKPLNNDPKMIVKAASEAQKAAEYIKGQAIDQAAE